MNAAAFRAWREQTGLTQEGMGVLLGLSRATISRFERDDAELPGWMSLARDGWRFGQFRSEIGEILKGVPE